MKIQEAADKMLHDNPRWVFDTFSTALASSDKYRHLPSNILEALTSLSYNISTFSEKMENGTDRLADAFQYLKELTWGEKHKAGKDFIAYWRLLHSPIYRLSPKHPDLPSPQGILLIEDLWRDLYNFIIALEPHIMFSRTEKTFAVQFPSVEMAAEFVGKLGGKQQIDGSDKFNPGAWCALPDPHNPSVVTFPGYKAGKGEETVVLHSNSMRDRFCDILLKEARDAHVIDPARDNKVIFFSPELFENDGHCFSIRIPSTLAPQPAITPIEPHIKLFRPSAKRFALQFPNAEIAAEFVKQIGGTQQIGEDRFNPGAWCAQPDSSDPSIITFPGYKAGRGEETIVFHSNDMRNKFYSMLKIHMIKDVQIDNKVIYFPDILFNNTQRNAFIPVPEALKAYMAQPASLAEDQKLAAQFARKASIKP